MLPTIGRYTYRLQIYNYYWNNLILEHFVANIYLRRAKDDAAVASSIENKRISAQV